MRPLLCPQSAYFLFASLWYDCDRYDYFTTARTIVFGSMQSKQFPREYCFTDQYVKNILEYKTTKYMQRVYNVQIYSQINSFITSSIRHLFFSHTLFLSDLQKSEFDQTKHPEKKYQKKKRKSTGKDSSSHIITSQWLYWVYVYFRKLVFGMG